MVRFVIRMLACGVAFTFMALPVHGCGNQDRPVGSGKGGEPGRGIMEGVRGRVMAPDGRPVVGAFIQPKSLDSPSKPIREIAVLTDDEGRYSWPLVPGQYELSASARGYQPAIQSARVSSGQVVTVDFTLMRAP